jgi:hypothetical protein
MDAVTATVTLLATERRVLEARQSAGAREQRDGQSISSGFLPDKEIDVSLAGYGIGPQLCHWS